MKIYFTIIILSLLFFGCSSAPRYHYGNNNKQSGSGDKVSLLIKDVKHTAIFTASFYGDDFHGRLTSNGEVFDMHAMTAAHKTLPFNTVLKVTYPKTGKSVNVRIKDRGPFIPGRDIDLAYGAAKKIGLVNTGVDKVKITVIRWGE